MSDGGQQLAPGAARPQAIVHETFEAFRLLKGGEMRFEFAKPTLEECRDLCAAGTPHKALFVVKRTDQLSGAVTLHLYAVRQKSRGTVVIRDHVPKRVFPRYAEHVTDIRIVDPQYPDEAARRIGWPLGLTRPIANADSGNAA